MDSASVLHDAQAGQGEAAVAATSIAGSIMAAWADDPRALWTSFSMIVVSEIGDKTFLIAAILAMRQSRIVVFGGALGALALMSVLSAFMGVLLPTLLPRAVTTMMAAALFVVFGVRMLREGMEMKGDEMNDEWEEAKREVEREESHAVSGDEPMELGSLEEGSGPSSARQSHANGNGFEHRNGTAAYPEIRPYPPRLSNSPSSHARKSSSTPKATSFDAESLKEGARNLCGLCFSPIFAHAFVLTFLGEWGDRSQIATIALAAAHNIALVSIGTIVGHALCTSIAVLAGRWVATRISVKHVMLTGAALFLIFGLLYGIESLQEFYAGAKPSALAGLDAEVASAAAQKAAALNVPKGAAEEPHPGPPLAGTHDGVQFENDAPHVAAVPIDAPLAKRGRDFVSQNKDQIDASRHIQEAVIHTADTSRR